MRIHCRGCDRRFDSIRTLVEDGPFRGQWGFEAIETPPSPQRAMTDLSGHPWLRRVVIRQPSSRIRRISSMIVVVVVVACCALAAIVSGDFVSFAIVTPLLLGVLALGAMITYMRVDELAICRRELVWSSGFGRLRSKRTIVARYVQEMAVESDPSLGAQGRYQTGSLAARTSLGDHWTRVAVSRYWSPDELEWLAAHITRGIELDKLMDEEREPGR